MNFIKWLSVTIAAVLVFSLSAPLDASAITFTPTNGKNDKGEPVPLSFYSKSLYMLDTDTGEAIVEINSDDKRAPGYLTQLMTCALILDEFSGNEKKLKETKVSAGALCFGRKYRYQSVRHYKGAVGRVFAIC